VLDFSPDKFIVICIVAAILIGPKKLPEYAARLARLVRWFRGMVDGAQSRMRDELGPEYQDLDWKKLDLRKYDPRQIVRDSLMTDPESAPDRTEWAPNPFVDLPVTASQDQGVRAELDSRVTTRNDPT
jgi:sec-independent protein translocase protein TatB